jgi:hypothetical protein
MDVPYFRREAVERVSEYECAGRKTRERVIRGVIEKRDPP